MPNDSSPSGPRSPVDGAPADYAHLTNAGLLKLFEEEVRFTNAAASPTARTLAKVRALRVELAARLRASAAPDAAGREDTPDAELMRLITQCEGRGLTIAADVLRKYLAESRAARASSASSGGTRDQHSQETSDG